MPNCCDAKLLEGLMRRARKNRLVYLVLAEGGLVAFETQAPQPPTEVHDSALIQPKAHDPPDVGRSLTAPQQLRQLGDVGGDAPGLVAGEQCKLSFRFRLPFARQLLRLGDLRGGHFGSDLIAGRGSTF